MKRSFKRILATVLTVFMVMTAIPLSGIADFDWSGLFAAKAGAVDFTSYTVGETVTFGSYPQSLFTPSSFLESSYKKSKTKDCNEKVLINDAYFRRYYFNKYKTYADTYGNLTDYTYQDDNGYVTETPYWFLYEPIEWIVLGSNSDNTVTLISKNILDSQEFGADGSWSGSQIQNWLNTTFLNEAFSEEEQMAILNTSVSTETVNSVWFDVTSGGDTSKNKIYFLSYTEANSSTYGITSNSARQARASDYAKAMGCQCSGGYGGYWLRTIANCTTTGREVRPDGSLDDTYFLSNNNKNYVGVRPVIQINAALVKRFGSVNEVGPYYFNIPVQAIKKEASQESSQEERYVYVDGAVVSIYVGEELVAQSVSRYGTASFAKNDFLTMNYSLEYLKNHATVSAHLPLGNGLELCSEDVDSNGVWRGSKLKKVLDNSTPLVVDEPREYLEINVKYSDCCDFSKIKTTFENFCPKLAESTNGHVLISDINYIPFDSDYLLGEDYVKSFNNGGGNNYYIFENMEESIMTVSDLNARYKCDTAFSWPNKGIMVFDIDNNYFDIMELVHESGHGLFGFFDEYCWALGYFYDTNGDGRICDVRCKCPDFNGDSLADYHVCNLDCFCVDLNNDNEIDHGEDIDNDGKIDQGDVKQSGNWGRGFLEHPLESKYYGIMDGSDGYKNIEMSTDSSYEDSIVEGDDMEALKTQTAQYYRNGGSCEYSFIQRFSDLAGDYKINYTKADGIQDATYSYAKSHSEATLDPVSYSYSGAAASIKSSCDSCSNAVSYSGLDFSIENNRLKITVNSSADYDMLAFDEHSRQVEKLERSVEDSNSVFYFNYETDKSYHFIITDSVNSKLEISGFAQKSSDNSDVWTLSYENDIENDGMNSASRVLSVISSADSFDRIALSSSLSMSENYNFDSAQWVSVNDGFTPLSTTKTEEEHNSYIYKSGISQPGVFVLMAKPKAEQSQDTLSNFTSRVNTISDGTYSVEFDDSNDNNLYYDFYISKSRANSLSDAEFLSTVFSDESHVTYNGFFNDEGTYYITVVSKDNADSYSIKYNACRVNLKNRDSNNDGIPDSWFYDYYELTDSSHIAKDDSDSDGLTNLQEYQYGTNPLSFDTDGDNVSDTYEIWLKLNPLEPKTDGVTDDYVVAYGIPELSLDSSKILIDKNAQTVSIPIVNSASGQAMRTRIYLYNSDNEIIEINEVNIDSKSTVNYTFDISYLQNGMRIVLDEEHVTHDSDYSNNEFTYVKTNSISFENSEYRIVKGQTVNILPTTDPAGATAAYNWVIESDGGITIDSFGAITADSIGTATVTVTTADGLSASFTLKVISYEGADYSEFDTELSNGQLTVIGYIGTQSNVIIPDELSGYPVVGIGSNAFAKKTFIEAVFIPDSVKSFGTGAFSGCSGLSRVEYDGTLNDWFDISFGDYSANPNYYAQNLFINDEHIEGKIVMPDGLTKVPNAVLAGCKDITEVVIPESVISIGKSAFDRCSGLESIVIPDGVTTVDQDAFCDCSSLKDLTVPSSAKYTEDSFKHCLNIEKITITKGTGRMPNLKTTVFSSSSSYKYTPWYISTAVKEIVIENGVEYIGDNEFKGTSASKITVPGSVTDIGSSAISSNAIVYCYSNSAAHLYAEENNLEYILLDSVYGSDESTLTIDDEAKLIIGFVNGIEDLYYGLNIAEDSTISFDETVEKVYTGMPIKVLDKNGDVLSEYSAVIIGDTNGDGNSNGMDAVTVSAIVNGMLSEQDIGKAAYRAADCNKDGQITQTDIDLLTFAGVYKYDVRQTSDEKSQKADILFANEFDFDSFGFSYTCNGGQVADINHDNNSVILKSDSTDCYMEPWYGADNSMELIPGHTYRVRYTAENLGDENTTTDIIFFARSSETSTDLDNMKDLLLTVDAGQTQIFDSLYTVPADCPLVKIRFGIRGGSTVRFSDVAVQDITNPYNTEETFSLPDDDCVITVNKGTAYSDYSNTLPQTYSNGYYISGWYTEKGSDGNGTGEQFDCNVAVNSNVKLYPRWAKNPTITFDNEFDYSAYLFDGAYEGSLVKSDYDNCVELISSGNDCYTTPYNITAQPGYMTLEPGKTYRFSYKYRNLSDFDSIVSLLIFSFRNTASDDYDFKYLYSNIESNECGEKSIVYTVPEDRPYTTIRFGIGNENITVKFSDLYVQNITNTDGIADDITEPVHSISVPYNKTIADVESAGTLPVSTRSGYDFIGWFTGKNGTGTQITDSSRITEDIRVFSYWRKK